MSDPTDAVNVTLTVLLSISLGINLMAGLYADKLSTENRGLRAKLRYMQLVAEDIRGWMGAR